MRMCAVLLRLRSHANPCRFRSGGRPSDRAKRKEHTLEPAGDGIKKKVEYNPHRTDLM